MTVIVAVDNGEAPVAPPARFFGRHGAWSGRGRMATWLKRKRDAGEDIDDYLV